MTVLKAQTAAAMSAKRWVGKGMGASLSFHRMQISMSHGNTMSLLTVTCHFVESPSSETQLCKTQGSGESRDSPRGT